MPPSPLRSLGLLTALSLLRSGTGLLAQDNAAAAPAPAMPADSSALAKSSGPELTLGPLTLHPRATVGMTYDDNILYSTTNREADAYVSLQPGIAIGMGDQHREASLNPGDLVVQPAEYWGSQMLTLDYSPQLVSYDRYTANNAVNQFLAAQWLWPMNRLILGFRQDYTLVKGSVIEARQLTTVTTINSTLNLAYQISEKTSTESDFRRVQFDYNSANLVGYTEYNTEDWFNYNLTPALPVSVGGLAGYDAVAVAHRNQTYGQLRVRVRYTLSAKLALDASAGGELRAYDSGQSDTTTPVFSLTASYQLARRTLLSVTGSRQKYAFIFNGYNYLTTGANVYLTQDLTDRFTARASAGVESLQYLTTKHGLKNYTDQFYYARLDVEAKIIRHLTGQMYYSWKTWQSSVNGNVPDNQVGMNLTLKY